MIKTVPEEYHQDLPHVKAYVEHVKQFLDKRHSSCDVTVGVMSHDGTHHGAVVSRLLARVLLCHIQEVQSQHEW